MIGKENPMKKHWRSIVHFVSGEWILSIVGSNGGDVILMRSIFVAASLAALTMLLHNIVDPNLTECCSYLNFRMQILDMAPWFAAATGGVYAALYARFAAQWAYLAGLYNQIKQAELELYGSLDPTVAALKSLSQWKAGYIEDAHALHLHAKENVAATVHYWGKNQQVKDAFVETSAGGMLRWELIQSESESAFIKANSHYE